MASKLNHRSLLIRASAVLSATEWFQTLGCYTLASLLKDEFE